MADDVLASAGDLIGFSSWNLGMGSIGNFMMWLILVIFVFAIIGGVVIWWVLRRQYNQKIIVKGMMGNTPMVKWRDTAKIVPMGRAGDRLFFMRKRKRYIPPPELQSGVNEYTFWEREDGELINIQDKNVDLQMKEMGVHFIHSDMRMQRLGIEKNLQFRLTDESWWKKHGDQVMNIAFYVLMMVVLVVLFTQLGKLGDKLGVVGTKLDAQVQKVCIKGGGEFVTPSNEVPLGFLPLLFIRRWDKWV